MTFCENDVMLAFSFCFFLFNWVIKVKRKEYLMFRICWEIRAGEREDYDETSGIDR